MASTLADELRQIRELRGVSLRQVERKTGISNAYLSQLERGEATKPSPQKLYKLAEFYRVPYEFLMDLAGYMKRTNDSDRQNKKVSSLQVALMSANLDEDDQRKVAEYIAFLRTQRKKRKR
jgi:transcriptional regulator with XRE-family HTH domain